MDARARASSTCLLMLRMIPDRDVSFGSASSIVGAAAVLFWSLLGVPAAALVSDWSLLGVPAAALFLDWSLLGVPAAAWLFLSFSGVRAEASLLDWSLLEVRAAALLLDWSLWEVRAAASLLDWSLLVVGAGLGGLLLRLAFCGGLASGVVLVVSLWLGTGAFFSFFFSFLGIADFGALPSFRIFATERSSNFFVFRAERYCFPLLPALLFLPFFACTAFVFFPWPPLVLACNLAWAVRPLPLAQASALASLARSAYSPSACRSLGLILKAVLFKVHCGDTTASSQDFLTGLGG